MTRASLSLSTSILLILNILHLTLSMLSVRAPLLVPFAALSPYHHQVEYAVRNVSYVTQFS